MTYAMWDTISAKQMEFMRRREKYIAYGGARGGGKSWVARTKAVGMCLRYAGLRVLMVRKTFAQLRENIVLPMQEQFAPLYRAGAMRYNGQNNEVRFYNGSRIVFGYCDSDRDLLQYQGVEYDVIFSGGSHPAERVPVWHYPGKFARHERLPQADVFDLQPRWAGGTPG